MLCMYVNGLAVEVMNPQPTDVMTCQYVLASPQELGNQAFNLTPSEGAQLSAAIVAVWAIGFAARMGIRAMNIDESEK